MSFRAKRYVDSSDPIVKRPKFSLTYDFPFAKKAMSMNLQTAKQLLKKELQASPTYSTVWQYSTTMFQRKRRSLENQGKKPLPDECHIAIIAYTFETPSSNDGETLQIYVDFNKKCRELTNEASWERFPYKSLYYFLARSISGVHSNPSNNSGPYYRGVSFYYGSDFPDEELLADFSQFTSFSSNKNIALNFIKSQGGRGTLLVMTPPMASVGIASYSDFGEEEVLVFPWSTFAVAGARQQGPIHEILLRSEGPYFPEFSYTIDASKNDMSCTVS